MHKGHNEKFMVDDSELKNRKGVDNIDTLVPNDENVKTGQTEREPDGVEVQAQTFVRTKMSTEENVQIMT